MTDAKSPIRSARVIGREWAHLLLSLRLLSDHLDELGGVLGDDVPGVRDVVVGGVGRAHAEADHVLVVERGRHHVQLARRVDARQQFHVQLV